MPELHDPARAPTLSSVPSSVKPAPLTRAERVRRFGVDIPADRLEWKAGWQPGGEYTKQLVVKNVSTRVMKIKYRLPESKYFSMAFPETIKLTPGLAKVLTNMLDFEAVAMRARDACELRGGPKGEVRRARRRAPRRSRAQS